MRFMILLKASRESESGLLPGTELLAEMGRYNEALAEAGVLVAAEGLQASSKGARVRFSGAERTIVEGPFPDPGCLISGFWIFNVGSLQEAIDWVRRCPNPFEGEAEIEIRQIFEPEDFSTEFTPELREAEARLRAHIERHGKPLGRGPRQ